jgi:hypothetical protein
MATRLPANARNTSDEQEIFRRLRVYHGISEQSASERLHAIKKHSARGPEDNVLFDLTGGVFDPRTLEFLGSLTEGGS